MLDVHPPSEVAHSWRDFLVHIVTIVVGLLIAIGLEQTVERIHQSREVAETREALAEEREKNREIYRHHLQSYLLDSAVLHNDLRVFSYLQQHPKTALNDLPGVIVWPNHIFEPVTSAWTSAGHTNVLSLMPREEVRKNAETYFDLNRALEGYNNATLAIARAAAFTSQSSDPTRLSPEKIQQEIDLIEQANALHMLFGLWLQSINRNQPDFVPAFTDQQVFLFSDFQSAEAQRTKLPQAFAFTERDLKTAAAAVDSSNPSEAIK
ncbi:MAG: hypothetical protein WDN23_18610 [Edaphobacter sp.]